jgi:hypothetical protein
MSGRGMATAPSLGKKAVGLYTRLNSHASGRLSGDQFCVYVANRLVIPELRQDQLQKFGSGALKLDALTREYINTHLEYQFKCVETGKEALVLELACRRGTIFRVKPLLNPL